MIHIRARTHAHARAFQVYTRKSLSHTYSNCVRQPHFIVRTTAIDIATLAPHTTLPLSSWLRGHSQQITLHTSELPNANEMQHKSSKQQSKRLTNLSATDTHTQTHTHPFTHSRTHSYAHTHQLSPAETMPLQSGRRTGASPLNIYIYIYYIYIT